MRAAWGVVAGVAVTTGLAGCSLVISPDVEQLGGGAKPCEVDAECDDANACTHDVCRDGACANDGRDDDGDGFARADCGGDDCNDGSADVSPSALEVCDDDVDQDCDTFVDGDDPDCGSGPENDQCKEALLLETNLPDDEPGRIVGDTSALNDDDRASCAESAGDGANDAYFRIDLTTPREISLDTFGSEFDTVLSVRMSCDEDSSEIGCSADVNALGQSRVILRAASSETLYVILDGAGDGASGRYSLTYDVRAVRPQLTCDGSMNVTRGATVYGETAARSFEDHEQGSCGGDGSAEEVFRIDLRAPTTLRATTEGSDFDTVLYLRRQTCSGGTEVACVNDAGPDELTADLTEGTYHVFLDGAEGAEGAYRLQTYFE